VMEKLRCAGGWFAEIAEEMAGVAAAAGVDIRALTQLSLQYEAYCACTAVVVPTEKGGVALARTLDWEFPELKMLNIDVRLFKGKKLLYSGTTWAGYIGVLTAQRPGQYAAAVNFRERREDDAEPECDGSDSFPLPVGLAVRLAFERSSNYAQFVEDIATIPCMAPFYCMVASATGEGAQVTRAAGAELPRRQLGGETKYLLQANMDHWDRDTTHDTQESIVRVKLAADLLQTPLARGYVLESELWSLLWTYPIYETGTTLYCTVMDPSLGTFRSLSEPPEDALRRATTQAQSARDQARVVPKVRKRPKK